MKTTINNYSENFYDKTFTMKPLEHRGFNKHFVNLICAEVFMPKKVSLFNSIKNLFISSK